TSSHNPREPRAPARENRRPLRGARRAEGRARSRMKSLADGCGCFPTGRHYAGIAHLIRIQAIGVVEGFDADVSWDDLPIALIDVETTGKDGAVDRIIEIGIVVGRGGEVVERFSWLINPGCPIPEESRAVHGITDEMVADKPPFAAVAAEILAALARV